MTKCRNSTKKKPGVALHREKNPIIRPGHDVQAVVGKTCGGFRLPHNTADDTSAKKVRLLGGPVTTEQLFRETAEKVALRNAPIWDAPGKYTQCRAGRPATAKRQ